MARSGAGKLPNSLEVDAKLVHPGGWSPSGLMHSSYEERLQGRAMVVSRTHLYLPTLGRDLYPTVEQFEDICQGKPATLGLKQWA